jgi:hypothetical protein
MRFAGNCGPAARSSGQASAQRAICNDIDEAVIDRAFAALQIDHLEHATVPSDTRILEIRVHQKTAMTSRIIGTLPVAERPAYPDGCCSPPALARL